jgi:hypothetical protein
MKAKIKNKILILRNQNISRSEAALGTDLFWRIGWEYSNSLAVQGR